MLASFAISWRMPATAEAHAGLRLIPALSLFPEPPQWLKKPEGGVYSVGTNLVLLCEAIGNPEPSIQWKLNGMPIDGRCGGQRAPPGRVQLGCACVAPAGMGPVGARDFGTTNQYGFAEATSLFT